MAIHNSLDTGEVTDSAAIGASVADPERFAEIFHRHWDEIFRYISWRLGPQVAEDVGADVFTVAFRSRERYDLTRPDARPWLYGIATNLIRQHRRRERRRNQAFAQVDAEPTGASFTEASDQRMSAERLAPRLAAALSRLSPAERDLLLLVAWAELTYEEAAQALDVPMGTIRSRLHRIRKKVRRAFGGIDPMSFQEKHA